MLCVCCWLQARAQLEAAKQQLVLLAAEADGARIRGHAEAQAAEVREHAVHVCPHNPDRSLMIKTPSRAGVMQHR